MKNFRTSFGWTIAFIAFTVSKQASAQELQCFVNGKCTKSFHLATSMTEDEFECLANCKAIGDCEWFTFHKSLGMCESLKDCTGIDTEVCADCISGQTECSLPEPPVCWLKGQCTDSFHLATSKTDDEYECLQKCKDLGECKWFTFYRSLGLCESWKNCVTIDAEGCDDCTLGQKECKLPEPPMCYVTGECQGTEVSEVKPSNSKEQCLIYCKEIEACQWFTFLTDFQICYFFRDCTYLDESCTTCISGEKRCDVTPGGQGSVILLVGGCDSVTVELYSPEGECQHELAPIPTLESEIFRPILAYLDKKILVCGGTNDNKNCWQYHPENNTWSQYSEGLHTHNYQPGAIFDREIFFEDFTDPEKFNPVSKTWVRWPSPLVDPALGPCMVTWNDSFILLGGDGYVRGVQTFDHVRQKWFDTVSNTPMDLLFTACLVLPNELILVAASTFEPYGVALYNVETNRWTLLDNGLYHRRGASLTSLGQRVFLIGGEYSDIVQVEEFDYNSNTWTPIEQKLLVPRLNHGHISLPASLFQHLDGGCKGIL